MQLLERQLKAARDANEMQIEQLSAQLQREQLERSMAEGALESGRKDIARLMREVGGDCSTGRLRRARPTAPPAQPDRLRKRGLSSDRIQHRRRRENPAAVFLVALPHQLPHRPIQPLQRQRIHPAAHQLPHHADRIGVAPTRSPAPD